MAAVFISSDWAGEFSGFVAGFWCLGEWCESPIMPTAEAAAQWADEAVAEVAA